MIGSEIDARLLDAMMVHIDMIHIHTVKHCERFKIGVRNVRTVKSARSIDCDRVAGVADCM